MASYGIGAILRAERVRQGLSLDDVARKTKISLRFLGAIEEEDFDSLPGLVFARGFIRQYANLLKLDSESIVASLPKVEAVVLPEPEPPKVPAQPFDESWDPRWNGAASSVLWIGLALAAGIGGYLYFNRSGATVASTSKSSEARPPEPKRDVPVSPASQTSSAGVLGVGVSSASGSGSSTAPPASKPVQVTLTASEPAWVSITADGKNAFTGILKPEEKKQIDADGLVKLIAGNAGGLRVSLNGKDLEPLGPRGQVRTVRFTAAGPQFAPRTPGAPPLDPL